MNIADTIVHIGAAISVGTLVVIPSVLATLLLVAGRPADRIPRELHVLGAVLVGLVTATQAEPYIPQTTSGASVIVWGSLALLVTTLAIMGGHLNKLADYARHLKGVRGERQVARMLDRLDYPVRHDCYLGKRGGRVTQVDHLALVGSRIVVIETKNYYGEIHASDGDPKWTLVDEKGVTLKVIKSPLTQNDIHVRAVHDTFGVEPLGLVVMTDLSSFPKGEPRGVVQIRHLREGLDAIAHQGGDIDEAESAWERISSYLTGPEAPTREDHRRHLNWLKLASRDDQATQAAKAPEASCGGCGSDNVSLRYGWSHYWACRRCGHQTHIRPHPDDVARELDAEKAFAGRRKGGMGAVSGEAVPIAAEEAPVDLRSLRWPGKRRPVGGPDPIA